MLFHFFGLSLHLKLTDSGGLDILALEAAKLIHVRLREMDLLMILGLPSLNEQKLVCISLGIVVIVSVASVLCADSVKHALVANSLDESLSLAVKALEYNVYGVHIYLLWFYFPQL